MRTVLFIDDQEEILWALKRILRKESYEKIYTTSCKEALEILEKQKVDVLITDMLMPEMSGLELLEIVKSRYPDIVGVLLSGIAEKNEIDQGLKKELIYKHISKPWDDNAEVKRKIQEVIDYCEVR